MKAWLSALIPLCFIHHSAAASEAESGPGSVATGIAAYEDNFVFSRIYSLSVAKTMKILPDQGKETSLSLGGTSKAVHFKDPADLLEKQLKGELDIQERSGSIGITQGLGIGSSVGVIAGLNDSPIAKGHYAGIRLGQWFLDETLQTVLEYRRTFLEQVPLTYTDSDGKQVNTPTDLEGNNATLTMTHMTTPTTIMRGAYSITTRSDRPNAWSISGELRQFIQTTDSAVHVAATHYENIGQIEAVTTFGSVVSNTVRAEWHQRLMERIAASLGYRYYLEAEDPRAYDARDRNIGTDSVFGALRWRFSDTAWTSDSSEVSLFFNSFRSNSGVSGKLLGTSLTVAF